MSQPAIESPPYPAVWKRRHLIDLESLSREEIVAILDTAEYFRKHTDGCRHKLPLLTGRTTANLFFENSTRTRNSFSLAAKRLGADTVEFSSSGSSVSKGESFIDTAKTIEALCVDLVVVRHRTPGTPKVLSERLNCSVISGGDGPHEHPTQGLLDILTIRQHRGNLEGKTVALVGDIAQQPNRSLEYLGAEKTGGSRDRLRTFDAGLPPLGRSRRRSRAQFGQDFASLRRIKPAADSIRTAIDATVPISSGIRIALRDE